MKKKKKKKKNFFWNYDELLEDDAADVDDGWK